MIMTAIEAILTVSSVALAAKSPGARRAVQVFFRPDGKHRLPQD